MPDISQQQWIVDGYSVVLAAVFLPDSRGTSGPSQDLVLEPVDARQ